jgi:hypothetical protein
MHVSSEALQEIEAALREYEQEVESSNTTASAVVPLPRNGSTTTSPSLVISRPIWSNITRVWCVIRNQNGEVNVADGRSS